MRCTIKDKENAHYPAGASVPRPGAFYQQGTGRWVYPSGLSQNPPRQTGAGQSWHLMSWNPTSERQREGRTSILSCRSVFVRPAGLLPGSLMAHRSRQLASLHSVQGAHPLRRSAVIPLTSLHRFLPAGHAKHGATPSGVFDWTQSGQSGAWGNPNKAHREIQKDIPMPCLPTLAPTA